MTETEIHKDGFWLESEKSIHYHDPLLAETITTFLQNENVTTLYDLGCGRGEYVKRFIRAGINARGFDGTPDTKTIGGPACHTSNLVHPLLIPPADTVLSLEVGEHIPAEHETAFLENITRLAKRFIILSWAIPDQKGHGHVNCLPNESVISKLHSMGRWKYDDKQSFVFRKNSTLSWFAHTIMVFRK